MLIATHKIQSSNDAADVSNIEINRQAVAIQKKRAQILERQLQESPLNKALFLQLEDAQGAIHAAEVEIVSIENRLRARARKATARAGRSLLNRVT